MPSRTVLRNIPVFKELANKEIDYLATKTKLSSFPKKSLILKQGDPSNHIYFLVSGYAKIVRGGQFGNQVDKEKRKQSRKEVPIAVFGPGRIIGELASLTGSRRTASVFALSDCHLAQIEQTEFIEFARRNPDLAINVMRYLASVIVESNQQLELLKSGVEARIISLLRHLKEIGLPPEFYPSNAEIGRMVGASRVMVSTVIQRMQNSL
jgi:CRP/FNR family transcriptional regulator, cyclic AMP receptor protein